MSPLYAVVVDPATREVIASYPAPASAYIVSDTEVRWGSGGGVRTRDGLRVVLVTTELSPGDTVTPDDLANARDRYPDPARLKEIITTLRDRLVTAESNLQTARDRILDLEDRVATLESLHA